MVVRRLTLLVAGLGLASVVLAGAGYVVALREAFLGDHTPSTSALAREGRHLEPWSFVDEALARPRVTAALGSPVEVVGWDLVRARPSQFEVVARVRGRTREGAPREGRLHVVAYYYQGTVDDTAWGWQYPEVELETGDGVWSFAPPPARMSDPEGPRRW
jgi:hypothetical protein